MFLALNYPSWIHPEIFPGVPLLGMIRWYGLMYIFAFATAIRVFMSLQKEGMLDSPEHKATEDDIFGFFTFGIIGLLLGARIFSTLVYDQSGMYRKEPWLIFWPFDKNGTFTGLAGMSYHGGFIGGLIGMIVWCAKNKRSYWQWIDAMVVSIPLGYTFGRLGNFFNAELYGRITTVPWGMIFPGAPRFSLSIDWVQRIVEQTGISTAPGTLLVNLPRHPSQLYEAFFEGIVLFALLRFLSKKKPFRGLLSGVYTAGYGLVRFVIEYFREPDADIGYRISAKPDAPIYFNQSLFNLSTGQILCLMMIIGGLAIIAVCYVRDKKQKAGV
ncbi:prolipoprotein diacylglyceryl transferase [Treponema sp. HNW]|uniref:prolipoprotein diacylglyceryl transferase n=1 Tax=Treponema sp. HNW TaxID=3116654 RepID=UPI003D12EB08